MVDLAVGSGAESDPRREGLSPQTELRETPSAGVSAQTTDDESWREEGSVTESAWNGARVTSLHRTSDRDPPVSVPDASRLDVQRFQTVGRITAASQCLTDVECQKEELEQEMEMELALLQGELKAEREELERELRTEHELRTRIAGLSQALKAERDKEKAEVESERRKLEEVRERLAAAGRWFADRPEAAKEHLRERLQEQAEALEVAVKAFEDLEFQSLEKESRLEERRETQGWLLSQQVTQCRQRAVDRKERVRKLEEQIGQIKEQARNENQRLTERWNEARRALGTEEGTPFNLDKFKSAETGCGPFPDGAGRAKEDPSLCGNDSGSLPRRRRECRGTAETERPVSLHEKGFTLAPMHLLSLVALHRTNSFGTRKPKISSPPPGLRPAGPSDSPRLQPALRPETPTDLPRQTEGCVRLSRTPSLRSNGCSLQTLAEMERKLRAAMAEKERLLQARETQRRALEEVRRGEKMLNGEPMVSKPQPQLPATSAQSEALRVHRTPIVKTTFNLRSHVEASGHAVEACQHLTVTGSTCRGFLTKMGGRIKTWKKRWFVFDGGKRRLAYFTDKEETKLKGVIYFQAIEEVYFDHLRSAPKSPNPPLTFCLKTYDRLFYMVAPTDVALRIWMEVILTAVEGNVQF